VVRTGVSNIDDSGGHLMASSSIQPTGVNWMNEISAIASCIQLHDLETHSVADASICELKKELGSCERDVGTVVPLRGFICRTEDQVINQEKL
jgi:hypothetical protein